MAAFFDPNTIDDTNDFDLLAPGRYRVLVEAAQVKGNRSNDGRHVSVTMSVVEGNSKGRKVWHNFNIEHPNAKAQQIGQAQFARFLRACAITEALETPMDVVKVVNAVIGVEVQHRQGSDGQMRAEVKAFNADSTQPASASKPTPATRPSSPKQAQRGKPAPASQVSGGEDEEIPF